MTLKDRQKARIRQTYEATGRMKLARDRVGPTYRVAASRYLREEFPDAPPEPGTVETPEKPPMFRGVLSPGELVGSRQPLPPGGTVKRYLLTCAQNNTVLNRAVWENLLALKEYYDAELLVGRVMYDRRVDRRNQKTWAADPHAELHSSAVAYAPEVEPYILDSPTELAPGLRWCGELNVHITIQHPLSGFEGYGKGGSIVVPHPRIAMESFPRMGSREEPRFGYTTGAVTAINYIPRGAGQKAAFAHCYGALLVEVDHAGRWWARQVQASEDGTLCDLDLMVEDGNATHGNQVEAVVWGDLHQAVLPNEVRNANWGTIIHRLKPRVQVFHDALDFRTRNHHDDGKALLNYRKWELGQECVEDEVASLAAFLYQREVFDDCTERFVVVDSNHDAMLARWLEEGSYKTDPVNAVYFLKLELARYGNVNDAGFHLLEHAVQEQLYEKLARTTFLRKDESYKLHGIEHGLHGHRGVDGRRGASAQFAKLEAKASVGHTHSAKIHAGVYTAGTCSPMRLSYTSGPTTWSWSHIALYQNGERAIVTLRDGRPWA